MERAQQEADVKSENLKSLEVAFHEKLYEIEQIKMREEETRQLLEQEKREQEKVIVR